MSRPLMWVGVAYTLGVIWAAGDQKLFYGTAGIVLFVWITGRIRQPWKEKRLFWLLPVFFVSGFVIFDHAMTDVKDASMENQFIHTRGMICQSEAKEKTLAVTLSDADINGRKKKLLLYMEKDAPVASAMILKCAVYWKNLKEHPIRDNLTGCLIIVQKALLISCGRMVIPLSVKEILIRRCLIK